MHVLELGSCPSRSAAAKAVPVEGSPGLGAKPRLRVKNSDSPGASIGSRVRHRYEDPA